jgi:hypothetical protein
MSAFGADRRLAVRAGSYLVSNLDAPFLTCSELVATHKLHH